MQHARFRCYRLHTFCIVISHNGFVLCTFIPGESGRSTRTNDDSVVSVSPPDEQSLASPRSVGSMNRSDGPTGSSSVDLTHCSSACPTSRESPDEIAFKALPVGVVPASELWLACSFHSCRRIGESSGSTFRAVDSCMAGAVDTDGESPVSGRPKWLCLICTGLCDMRTSGAMADPASPAAADRERGGGAEYGEDDEAVEEGRDVSCRVSSAVWATGTMTLVSRCISSSFSLALVSCTSASSARSETACGIRSLSVLLQRPWSIVGRIHLRQIPTRANQIRMNHQRPVPLSPSVWGGTAISNGRVQAGDHCATACIVSVAVRSTSYIRPRGMGRGIGPGLPRLAH